jgi:predicted nucleic acid-binding protein
MTDRPASRGYMLDTNIFDRVVDGKTPLAAFAERSVFATHVQRDELGAACPERARALLEKFEVIDPGKLATVSAAWNVSKWGEAGWGDDDRLWEQILGRIKELDQKKAKKRKPKRPENQQRDALIAETAIKHGLTLVTDDTALLQAVGEFGGHAISGEGFV